MEGTKNSILFGMIEEKYGTKVDRLGLTRTTSEQSLRSGPLSTSGIKGKRTSAFLSTIKKMVNFSDSSSAKRKSSSVAGLLRQRKNLTREFSADSHVQSDWWDPPQNSLPVEFCQDTSLHGLKYIGQPQRHLSERIFWFLAFVAGLSIATWLISEMWTKYKQNPVIVSFQPFETNVDQVPFPAITICNMNKVMKTKADDFIKRANADDEEARRDAYYLDHVCSSTKSFAKRFNFSRDGELQEWQRQKFKFNDTAFTANLTKVNEFLRKAAQNCTDMIPLCVWQDVEVDCSTLFRPIETEFGKCCTFNMVPLSLLYTLRNDSRDDPLEIEQWQSWDIDSDGMLFSSTAPYTNQFPRRQMKAGLTSGLSVLLNVNSKEYYCTSSDSIGFRMTTHLPVEVPKIADFGISLRPRSEIFVDVIPQITMSDEDIYSFSLDKRNCYKKGEYKLNHYKYYSVENCINECIANDTIAKCGCKRYYMPRNASEQLCGPQKFECAEEVKFNKTKNGIRNTCNMCLPSCTEIYYEMQSTSAFMKNTIWKYGNGSGDQWEQENLSIVHVYVSQDSFYAKVRKELYGPTDLFANTGGLMGLCLGFSGLSLMEVIYFLTLRAWWKSRRKHVLPPKQKESTWAAKNKLPKDEFIIPTAVNQQASYYRSIFGEIRQFEEMKSE
ncbi:unnamed protein product [Orchesella dallaii]|uniref:Pickpocket protein 28 n=1 Tax=Orchesella dallaii TaxID=48710 RepID=A0ABP1QD74_9HEXA